MNKFLIILMFAAFSFHSFAAQTHLTLVPEVKETILNYVVKNQSSEESYKLIKNISLSAVSYIQSEGDKSSEQLNELITLIQVRYERDSIHLKREDIVATIISAINS